MLSPGRDDEDDDTHLCIKCNSTIIGLDNYVKHRKERCGKKYRSGKTMKTNLPNLDSLEPSLGADVFFQSLELQSSAKKSNLSRLALPIAKSVPEKKQTLTLQTAPRDIPRMSPLENKMRGEDWIGGHSIRIGNIEADNQTKLINAVASISGVVKKDTSASYSIVPYNDDEDSDDATEESEDEDDEEPPPTGGKWKPPPHHTGGKWRPDSPDHEDWDAKDEHEYTGGKWKPILPSEAAEGEEDYDAPPPGHTKGKWVPGAQESKNPIMQTMVQIKTSVQYWCGPCNRRLGSKAIYDKHLLSNLHLKRILPENDLEFSGHMEPPRSTVVKRASRPSQYTNDSIYQVEKTNKRTKMKLDISGKKKRRRKPYYTHCFGCRSRVRVHLMGKHLISHYHFRKATNIKSEAYQQLILENMNAIVQQSPFQCSPCKFYTNLLPNFLQHWFSKEHESKTSLIEGKYWCSFCKFECFGAEEMHQHMLSSDHSEVIAVINRSMPIIIRKKTIFKCNTCLIEFRFNIEIKKHCLKTGHTLPHSATDLYQELHKCDHCNVKFRSSLKLAAHLKMKHKRPYLCLVCSKDFGTSEEATKHRQTSEHIIRRKELMKERGVPIKDLSKKCPHCVVDVVLKNVLELKQHIMVVHPDIRKKCPKCGMAFIFPQEVTRHIRSNACQFQTPDQVDNSKLWNCSQCLFTTDSQAECFFHEALHTEPYMELLKIGDRESLVQKYVCPICPKGFRKASLRNHIRLHTFERPFLCTICGANFTRQSSLINHINVEHGSKSSPKSSKTNKLDIKTIEESKLEGGTQTQNTNAIPSCSSSENKLRQHTCPHDKCNFVSSTLAQLARHRRSHGERVKHHECPFCSFKTHQASGFKRHMRCHAGDKPYACPHCPFVCGSLENLRKHALGGARHPGCFLYACGECHTDRFRTNMAAELRAHLVSTHHLDTRTAVEAVKRHLIKPDHQPFQLYEVLPY